MLVKSKVAVESHFLREETKRYHIISIHSSGVVRGVQTPPSSSSLFSSQLYLLFFLGAHIMYELCRIEFHMYRCHGKFSAI